MICSLNVFHFIVTSIPSLVQCHSSRAHSSLLFYYRFCRHEKELAETRRDLAETENLRHKQLLESTKRELADSLEQLQQLSETTSSRAATAEQHAEILKKVGSRLDALSPTQKKK